ncbi:hypothetical protein OUZ56_016325 [Daphnia magna]|uniref:Uncharacterized protein n=1 Tax=Daphnia magna TaxID=35525 RepID=A0ABR0AQB1_9CRUS|nr:hypothetical protein OUZ56_016325 [Daphnia magna]
MRPVRISLECPTALLRAVKTQKNYIHTTSKSDIGLSGGYKKDVLNIRPRHLSDIRRTALCYVGVMINISNEYNVVDENQLNRGQKLVFDCCKTYFQAQREADMHGYEIQNPIHILVHGGPGTGK